jgi:hypothetical protein
MEEDQRCNCNEYGSIEKPVDSKTLAKKSGKE